MPLEKNINGKFTGQVLIAVGIIVMTVLLILLVYFILDIILLIFSAILLAVFLRGLADFLKKYTRVPESFSVLSVTVLRRLVLAGAIAFLAPDVAEQYRYLRAELPKSINKVSDYISQFGWGRTILQQMPNSGKLLEKLNNIDYSSLLTQVGGYFSSTVGAIGNFFVVILVAIYLAIEPKFYTDGLTKLFPLAARPRVQEVWAEIGNTLSWWLIGKTLSMLFIGILTWIGLSILGVPLALTLGLIAGLLSFIPNFGPIFSAVPAILLAFIDSPIKALYVLILFVIVQIIESNLVTPFIERRTVELPPALTIVAQIALGVMLGGLGLVLATPLLAVIIVIVQMVYVQDVLGDKNTEIEEIQRKEAKPQSRKNSKKEISEKTPEQENS
jgi:predicted PurR-regulated permease PerM